MQLPAELDTYVEAYFAAGNELMGDGQLARAIETWTHALHLLPEPRFTWDAYTWLCASIGDAHYALSNLERARDCFRDALNGPDGTRISCVQYRLGQCQFKLGALDAAVVSLLKVYVLGGEDLFRAEEDGLTYLHILKDRHFVR